MSKTLTLDGPTARKIYPTASPEIKAILEDTFKKEFFSLSLRERINSWEDIAAELGVDPVKSLPYPNPNEETGYPVFNYPDGTKSDPVADKKHKNAAFRMEWLTRVFNNKKLEYDSGKQGKCWGWFKKSPAGFGVDGVHTHYDGTITTVGPRLSFLDEKDLRYVANHPELSKIYNEYYSQ